MELTFESPSCAVFDDFLDPREMHAIFEAQLATPEAQMQLAEATEIATEKPAALLCFEADASGCHRRIVAERIRERTGSEVVDL